MAYDEALAERVNKALENEKAVTTKKMFGGLCYLVNGNMCCGIVDKQLMLRVGPDQHQEVLALKHTKPMDFTGRPMTGMVYVESSATKRKDSVQKWVQLALNFARSLPRKVKKPPKKRAL